MPERGRSGRLEQVWKKRFRRGPMDPVARATLRIGEGLVGNTDVGGSRQITLISQERWEAVTQTVGFPVDPAARRANLLVSGIDLEASRGRVLRIGPCRVRINGETRPCERMDDAHPGLREALEPHWGGGAYGEVIADGDIAIGDAVGWELVLSSQD